MKRKTVVWVFLLVLIALAVVPVEARVIENSYIPKWWDETIPCTGDSVVLTGDMHLLITETVDANGGYHTVFHANPQGLHGVSQQGVAYRGVGVTSIELNVDLDDAPYEYTRVAVYDFIGPGPRNDFHVHEM